MPLYEHCCGTCGYQKDLFLKIAELDVQRKCPECKSTHFYRKISAVRVMGDYESYECPVTGKEVSGRKAHNENLKRTGCRLLETGEKEELVRARAAEERALDRSLDREVDKIVETMPAQQLESLANEVGNGADVVFDRK